jgi:hypothetical protein
MTKSRWNARRFSRLEPRLEPKPVREPPSKPTALPLRSKKPTIRSWRADDAVPVNPHKNEGPK